MSSLTLHPLPGIGAEVHGVDRARLTEDAALPAFVLDAVESHGVVVFPGIDIDDETQAGFAHKLGEVVLGTSDRVPGVGTVSLDPNRTQASEYIKGAVNWHMDGATQAKPPNKATILSAHVITDQGDGTDFASTYNAYDELSASDKARYASLRVVHTVEATQRRIYPEPTAEQEAAWANLPRHEHPLVWHHRSGRHSLVLGATALGVVGMDEEEGQALLAELEEWTTRPGRVYRHMWTVGDMVIWDNLGLVHKALPYDETSPRELHRTVLVGDEPIE